MSLTDDTCDNCGGRFDPMGDPLLTKHPEVGPYAVFCAVCESAQSAEREGLADGKWHGNELSRDDVDSWLRDEAGAMNACKATRGYCGCDKPDDGHRYHHCPECATHPNGGWAFSTWTNNPLIRSVDRAHESMHEYANDPWAVSDEEADA